MDGEDELISTCILLLNAGHEATVNVIGNGMLALLRRMPNLQLDGDEPEYRDTYVIRGLKALPVTF